MKSKELDKYEIIKEIESLQEAYLFGEKALEEAKKLNLGIYKKKKQDIETEDTIDYPIMYPFDLKDILTITLESNMLIIFLKSNERKIYNFLNVEILDFFYKRLIKEKNGQENGKGHEANEDC